MDSKNLRIIFDVYIKNFEKMNNDEHSEYMKWEFAKAFSEFDFYTDNFSQELKRLKKISSILIDGSRTYPFGAMVTYSEKEPETVRSIFLDLFADDNGDFKIRQNKIDTFVNRTEELREKYNLGPLSKNNQRSAMAFLFFRNPDKHYLYKANQAREFAEAVGFYDEWGSMSNFKMDVFYKMCDWLVSEIKKYPPLLETNASRYEILEGLHSDTNYHILAFDIIYASQVYSFYKYVEKKPMDSATRKLRLERISKAKEYSERLQSAGEEKNKLTKAKEFVASQFSNGSKVMHKLWKLGTIESIKDGIAVVKFDAVSEEKSLGVYQAVISGILTLAEPDTAHQLQEYIPILKIEKRIEREYNSAVVGYSQYAEYLEEV